MSIKINGIRGKAAPLAIKETLKKISNIFLSLLSFFILILLLRWAGIKGIVSFIAGMIMMAYLLLSNNIMMRTLVDMFGAGKNIREIMTPDKGMKK